jgi:hypothetical protein
MNYQKFESKVDRITQDYVSNRENVALTIGVVEQGNHYLKQQG